HLGKHLPLFAGKRDRMAVTERLNSPFLGCPRRQWRYRDPAPWNSGSCCSAAPRRMADRSRKRRLGYINSVAVGCVGRSSARCLSGRRLCVPDLEDIGDTASVHVHWSCAGFLGFGISHRWLEDTRCAGRDQCSSLGRVDLEFIASRRHVPLLDSSAHYGAGDCCP
ncbi:MAG: hypothetical protein RL413_787, partial [Actinomycetota bacterium]